MISESAIVADTCARSATAIITGNGNTSGVGLFEAYDLGQGVLRSWQISARGPFVSTGDNILIAGFTLGGNSGDD